MDAGDLGIGRLSREDVPGRTSLSDSPMADNCAFI